MIISFILSFLVFFFTILSDQASSFYSNDETNALSLTSHTPNITKEAGSIISSAMKAEAQASKASMIKSTNAPAKSRTWVSLDDSIINPAVYKTANHNRAPPANLNRPFVPHPEDLRATGTFGRSVNVVENITAQSRANVFDVDNNTTYTAALMLIWCL